MNMGTLFSPTFHRTIRTADPHTTDRIDPRVAWSEGWGTFFACAALGNSRYIDTGANRTRIRCARGIRHRHAPGQRRADRLCERKDSCPHSLGNVRGEPRKTTQGLGFKPIWSILRSKSWAERPAYRTVLDFCDAFREADSFGQDGRNDFAATVVYRFDLAERTKVKFHLQILASQRKQADLDLYLRDQDGKRIAYSIADNGVGGSETIERTMEPGVYFVEVQSHSNRGSNAGAFRLEARVARDVVQLK
ncbi:MAG: PPC domain-containing protein [Gemmataceae bacterium]